MKRAGAIRAAVVIGTRPEAVKMAPVIRAMKKRRGVFRPIVLVSGQHREMLDQILVQFRIRADRDMNLMRPRQKLPSLTSRALLEMGKAIAELRPDILLVQGDTTTSFAAALAAFYAGVRIGHVEAGLRTWNKASPFPEEMNRKLISAMCDLHFAPTPWAAGNLKHEGIAASTVHVTGNTVVDALFQTVGRGAPRRGGAGVNRGRRTILLTAHRRESFGEPLENIFRAVRRIVEAFDDVEVVYPVHRNPKVREPARRLLGGVERVSLVDPLEYRPFVRLMSRSFLILTDSGGIQEEAPSLGKPVLVLRDVTERPEGVRAGTVKVVGTGADAIFRSASRLLKNEKAYLRMSNAVNPYGDGKAGERIVAILESETRRRPKGP